MIDLIRATQPVWMSLGLTLAHFLWQGAALALVTAAALWLLRRRSPNARYGTCGLAMLLMAVCPIATLWYVRANPLPIPADISAPRAPAAVHGTPGPDKGAVPVAVRDASESLASSREPSLPGRSTPSAPSLRLTASSAVTAAPPMPGPDVEAARADTTPGQRWLVWGLATATFAWLLGVFVLGGRLMIGWLGLHRLRSRDTEPLPEAIETLVRSLGERLGLSASIPVWASRRAIEPLAFGLVRPMVLLPIAVLTQCPAELIEAMIAHELAHIRRYDLWVNTLQRVVETVLFYHPAVWWVSGRMRLERELCCDDLAIRATGRRAEYASALVELCRARSPLAAPALAAGMFGPRMTLAVRVRRALRLPSDRPESNRSRFWVAGPMSLLLAASFISVACLRAADDGSRTVAATPATTRPAAAAPATPEGKVPQTAIIRTDFSRVDSRRKWIEAQREALASPIAVIKALYAFRDALGNADVARLRELFQPNGEPASEQEIRQLLSDAKALGLDRDPLVGWSIRTVYIAESSGSQPGSPEAGAKKMALVVCWPFTREYDGRMWQMVPTYRLIPDAHRGWLVARLSMPLEQDSPPSIQEMIGDVCEAGHSDTAAVMLTTFDRNHPNMIERRVMRPVIEAKPGGAATIVRVDTRDYRSETVDDSLREMECFPLPPTSRPSSQPTSMPSRRLGRRSAPPASLLGRDVTVSTPTTELKADKIAVQRGPRAAQQPLEERTYSFDWDKTPLAQVLRDVEQSTGLSVRGLSEIEKTDKGRTAPQAITFRSAQPMKLDEALTVLDHLLADAGYWAVRRGSYLDVRLRVDWFRDIPPANMFGSEAAYRQAKLPAWDVASVVYDARFASPRALMLRVMDYVPDNTLRAHDVASNNQVELAGFVEYVDRALEIIKQWDVPAHAASDEGREPSVAAQKLLLAASGKGPVVAARPAARKMPHWVSAATKGLVVAVLAESGQRVKKGDLLVRLDDEDLRIELEAAQARLDNAKVQVERARQAFRAATGPDAEVRKAELELKLAMLDVQRWQLRVQRTRICSPADGIVTTHGYAVKPPLVGMWVEAGDGLLVVESTEEPAEVPSSQPAAARRAAGTPGGDKAR